MALSKTRLLLTVNIPSTRLSMPRSSSLAHSAAVKFRIEWNLMLKGDDFGSLHTPFRNFSISGIDKIQTPIICTN